MGRKTPLVIHFRYLHRPGAPPVREVEVNEKKAVTIIRTNDGREATPADEQRAAELMLDYRDRLRKAPARKKVNDG